MAIGFMLGTELSRLVAVAPRLTSALVAVLLLELLSFRRDDCLPRVVRSFVEDLMLLFRDLVLFVLLEPLRLEFALLEPGLLLPMELSLLSLLGNALVTFALPFFVPRTVVPRDRVDMHCRDRRSSTARSVYRVAASISTIAIVRNGWNSSCGMLCPVDRFCTLLLGCIFTRWSTGLMVGVAELVMLVRPLARSLLRDGIGSEKLFGGGVGGGDMFALVLAVIDALTLTMLGTVGTLVRWLLLTLCNC